VNQLVPGTDLIAGLLQCSMWRIIDRFHENAAAQQLLGCHA
jgi:hypothetical protein